MSSSQIVRGLEVSLILKVFTTETAGLLNRLIKTAQLVRSAIEGLTGISSLLGLPIVLPGVHVNPHLPTIAKFVLSTDLVTGYSFVGDSMLQDGVIDVVNLAVDPLIAIPELRLAACYAHPTPSSQSLA